MEWQSSSRLKYFLCFMLEDYPCDRNDEKQDSCKHKETSKDHHHHHNKFGDLIGVATGSTGGVELCVVAMELVFLGTASAYPSPHVKRL